MLNGLSSLRRPISFFGVSSMKAGSMDSVRKMEDFPKVLVGLGKSSRSNTALKLSKCQPFSYKNKLDLHLSSGTRTRVTRRRSKTRSRKFTTHKRRDASLKEFSCQNVSVFHLLQTRIKV